MIVRSRICRNQAIRTHPKRHPKRYRRFLRVIR